MGSVVDDVLEEVRHVVIAALLLLLLIFLNFRVGASERSRALDRIQRIHLDALITHIVTVLLEVHHGDV